MRGSLTRLIISRTMFDFNIFFSCDFVTDKEDNNYECGDVLKHLDSFHKSVHLATCKQHDPKFLSASEPLSPAFNFYNGGSRPRNTLLDHYVVFPHEAMPYHEAIKMDERLYDRFMQIYVQHASDEDTCPPCIQRIKEGLDLLRSAISELRYKNEVSIGLDFAASEFYGSDKTYRMNFKVELSEVQSKVEEKFSRFILSHLGWIYGYWYKIDIETTGGCGREFTQKIKSGMISSRDRSKGTEQT